MLSSKLPFHIYVLLATLPFCFAQEPHAECDFWAQSGECEKNPGFMLESCAAACAKITIDDESISQINSFFDLEAKDINGDFVDFASFRGQVTVVTNVASYCGYTEQHYNELVQLNRLMLKRSQAFQILAFPCNQFGAQEPESCDEIRSFAVNKGVVFQMMDKIDVNGADASRVYKYMKAKSNPPVSWIEWNFSTYFIINPDGEIRSFAQVSPLELSDHINDLFDGHEL